MARTVELEHRPRQTKRSRALEAWMRIGRNLLRLAIIGLLLSFFFLLYGLLSGDYGRFPNAADGTGPLSPQEQATMLTNLQGALLVLVACGWIAAILALALYWGTEIPSLIVGLIGLFAYMGMPVFVSAILARQGFYVELGPNQIISRIIQACQVVGKVAMILALVRFVGAGLFAVAVRPTRREKRAREAAPKPAQQEPARARQPVHLIRRCWEMAFCSDSLREHCPSYKTRTPCWKRRTGCQCDPYFAVRIMEPVERAAGVALSQEDEYARAHLRNNPAWQAKEHATKETCSQCPIYIEHQHYKYRALFWLAYPAAAGAVFVALPFIRKGYDWAEETLTRMVHGMAVLPNTKPELAPFVNTVVAADVEIVVIAAVALIIVTYIIRALEWAIFEAMI